MAYKLSKFTPLGESEISIPGYEAEHDVGSGPVAPSIITTPSGAAFDTAGSEQARRLGKVIDAKGVLAGTSSADLLSKANAWLAAVGKRGYLYRESYDGSAEHYCEARLIEADIPSTPETDLGVECTLSFARISPCWYGDGHDGTTTLSASPGTITLANNGNARVANPLLTLMAGAADITDFAVTVTGKTKWNYDGTVAAGNALVINCGVPSVRNAGSADYRHFHLNKPLVVIDDWLQLPPGETDIVVEIVGGDVDSTLRVEHADGWA